MANTTTLGDIAHFVAHDILSRSDAANAYALKAAVRAYRSICGKVPFEELKVESSEIPVTAGTYRYDLGSLLEHDVSGIIAIRYTPASGSGYRMIRRNHREDLARATTATGQARIYSRSVGTSIDIHPVPNNSSDTFKVYYWKKPTIATKPEDTLLEMPEEWEELLELETLHRTYTYLGNHQDAMMLMQPNPVPMPGSTKKRFATEVGPIPRLWNDLLSTRDWSEGVDEDFSINPQSRRYTHG